MADDLTLYIPTFRRTDRQRTWDQIPERWRARTFLVVRPDEERVMRDKGYPVVVIDEDVPAGLAPTRQWIVDQHDVDLLGPHAFMMDDDFYFFRRRTDDPTKFLRLEPMSEDVGLLMDAVAEMFHYAPLAGIAGRAGANRNTEPYLLNTRVYGCWGVDVEVMRREAFDAGRVPVMEDFDLHLQFLERGYPMLVLNTHCKDDRGSNTEGGVSEYRDESAQKASAELLASLHPEFVKVRTATAWKGMGTRYDVTVQWKRAYAAGVEARRLVGEPLHPEPRWMDDGPVPLFTRYESS